MGSTISSFSPIPPVFQEPINPTMLGREAGLFHRWAEGRKVRTVLNNGTIYCEKMPNSASETFTNWVAAHLRRSRYWIVVRPLGIKGALELSQLLTAPISKVCEGDSKIEGKKT